MTHLTHKGWTFSPPEYLGCPWWTATGPDYDAEHDGFDWTDNGQKVEARTFKDLIQEIEEYLLDQAENA